MAYDLLSWAQRWNIPADALTELAFLPEPATIPDNETAAIQQIRLDAARDGVTLFRNNSGVMINPNGRPVRFGLGNESKAFNAEVKSSDLIGLQPGTGRFIAVEAKRVGWKWKGTPREKAQLRFGDHVVSRGGLFCFATSWAEVRLKLGI